MFPGFEGGTGDTADEWLSIGAVADGIELVCPEAYQPVDPCRRKPTPGVASLVERLTTP